MHQCIPIEDREKAKITNRYNQVPHLTQDTIQRMIKSQENITQKRASLEIIPFPTGEHEAAINRHHRRQRQTRKRYVLERTRFTVKYEY